MRKLHLDMIRIIILKIVIIKMRQYYHDSELSNENEGSSKKININDKSDSSVKNEDLNNKVLYAMKFWKMSFSN